VPTHRRGRRTAFAGSSLLLSAALAAVVARMVIDGPKLLDDLTGALIVVLLLCSLARVDRLEHPRVVAVGLVRVRDRELRDRPIEHIPATEIRGDRDRIARPCVSAREHGATRRA
jgi:hypothetical protein